MVRTATCCCGRSRIEVEGEPAVNAVCHCDNCRRRTGSAFGWSAYFKDSQVIRTEGDFRHYMITGKNPQQRWFCATCGTTLFWKTQTFADHTGIAGGCFLDPLPEPTLSASNDKRHEWVRLPNSWRTSP